MRRSNPIPTILEREEVFRIINRFRARQLYTWYFVVYSCGLRAGEALNLTIKDIDSTRKKLIIRNGKGGKNREVPLPQATLEAMRDYWATHRNPKYIFPARGRNNNEAAISDHPMPIASIQIPLQQVLKELSIQKRVTPHTFRHSYATHLLDKGVNIRHVQFYLGHVNIETTCIYLHLTKDASEKAVKAIDELMEGLLDGKDKPNI